MSYDEHLISMAGGDGEPEPLDLDAIHARADAATEGPWDFEPIDGQFGVYSLEMQDNGDYPAVIGYPAEGGAEPDAEFIAHARTDVPALLALVREQQARIERGLALARNLDRLAPGDQHYAGLIRAALTATEGA